MCNNNCLFVKNKVSDITPFLMAVSSLSFASNSDGEGIYFDSSNEVFKSVNKMDYYKHKDKIENSKVIITHQRFSTSGFDLKFNHPFVNDNFVLIHNGVINQFLNGEGSDTYGFWIKFNEEFAKIKRHLSREQKLVKVISKLFESDNGTYSILIYDKHSKNSYYFKNSTQSISFYTNENYLFVTTNYLNEVFLSMLDANEFKELEIDARAIYKIDKEFKIFKIYSWPVNKELINEKQMLLDYDELLCDNCGVSVPSNKIEFLKNGNLNCYDCWRQSKEFLLSQEEELQ